jgi:hypothetical protein
MISVRSTKKTGFFGKLKCVHKLNNKLLTEKDSKETKFIMLNCCIGLVRFSKQHGESENKNGHDLCYATSYKLQCT